MDKRPIDNTPTDQPDATAVMRKYMCDPRIAASPVPIVVIDADKTVHLWNPAAQELFGRSKEQVTDDLTPVVQLEQHDGAPGGDASGVQASVCPPGPVAAASARRLLQAVTDACRLISGAPFAASSVCIANDAGRPSLLYARSGALGGVLAPPVTAREPIGFAPMSRRNTTDRAGDNPPHRRPDRKRSRVGASREQVPHGSYLVLPIIDRAGAICGGMFVDRPDAEAFTTESERVVVALAADTGIAIDNARLYQTTHRERGAALTRRPTGAPAALRLVGKRKKTDGPAE